MARWAENIFVHYALNDDWARSSTLFVTMYEKKFRPFGPKKKRTPHRRSLQVQRQFGPVRYPEPWD